jgi:NADPH:quinone reductase-like Zn-dependent oxidoreductase
MNKAAWLKAAKAKPFEIDDAAMPVAGPHDIVIRSHAVAINPADVAIQSKGIIATKYPFIPGCDVAGEVIEVGSSVSRFQKGDRVIAMMDGFGTGETSHWGFQLYCATNAKAACKLPQNISYAQGSVLPLALSTAAAALFEKESMALTLPQAKPVSNSKVLLVWGGSSSVGSCAIQLAKGAGFEVATTASGHNLEYCTDLGVDYVFDYTKDTVVEDIAHQLQGKVIIGVLDSISSASSLQVSSIAAKQLTPDKALQTVLPIGFPLPPVLQGDIKIGYGKFNTPSDSALLIIHSHVQLYYRERSR